MSSAETETLRSAQSPLPLLRGFLAPQVCANLFGVFQQLALLLLRKRPDRFKNGLLQGHGDYLPTPLSRYRFSPDGQLRIRAPALRRNGDQLMIPFRTA